MLPQTKRRHRRPAMMAKAHRPGCGQMQIWRPLATTVECLCVSHSRGSHHLRFRLSLPTAADGRHHLNPSVEIMNLQNVIESAEVKHVTSRVDDLE
jgi:hypothetical protein